MRILRWFRNLFGGESDVPPPEERVLFAPGNRLTKDLWVKLVDLPGYQEWAAGYDRLERIIPDLEDYHLLVHPEHVKQPPDGYFEQVFQGSLDDTYDHFAHLNLPRYSLQDYKRGGKLSNINS